MIASGVGFFAVIALVVFGIWYYYYQWNGNQKLRNDNDNDMGYFRVIFWQSCARHERSSAVLGGDRLSSAHLPPRLSTPPYMDARPLLKPT